MKLRLLLGGLYLAAAGMTLAQGITGSVTYQTVRFGSRPVPIYGVDPSDFTYEVHGDNLALYARRDVVLGAGYWAELWTGPSGAIENGLSPVPGSRTIFRDDINAIQGISNLQVAGTVGGDLVSFQLRVWAALTANGNPVRSWQDVLNHPEVARGKSNISKVVVGNISDDLKPYIPPNLADGWEGFGLYTLVVPEPGTGGLAALALSLLWLKISRRTIPVPVFGIDEITRSK